MKTLGLFLVLIAFSCPCHTQNFTWGIVADAGIGQFTFERDFASHYQESPNWSGSAGLFLTQKITSRFRLRAELLYVQINSISKAENVKLTAPINAFTRDSSVLLELGLTKDYAGYLGIPFLLEWQLDKINLQVGWQTMMGLFYFSKNHFKGVFIDEPFDDKNTVRYHTNAIDYGLKFGLGYPLVERIALYGRYYRGLRDLTVDERAPFVRRNWQVTLGGNYSF